MSEPDLPPSPEANPRPSLLRRLLQPAVAAPAALAAAVLALAVALSPWFGVRTPAFDAQAEAYLLANPEILVQVSNRLEEKRRADAQATVRQALLRDRSALEQDPDDFVANPNGTITVTEFFDYRCPYCQQVEPQIQAFIRQNPDVRFVFKEMPIFGGVSERAARAALAVKRAGGDYLAFHNRLMTARPLTDAVIDDALRAQGLDPAVANDEALNEHLTETSELAQRLMIQGTPAFIVGDTMVASADMAAVVRAVQAERQRRRRG
ncbi:DsbA family protein [Brevundimonas sp. 2R-24]|uniref:DsbA family protein n=1 Tax=Peiella sedimenti TaxID=3061083 RepID=A0ABT8SIP0_9CAUL|nr:DsbA family protein [Caulobacteraceae bacterium XZ-24]